MACLDAQPPQHKWIEVDTSGKSHVQPSVSDDSDDLVVTLYNDQFFADYDPTIRETPVAQWQQSTVQSPSAQPSNSSPQSIYSAHPIHQGHIHELEKVKCCLASWPLIQCQVRTLSGSYLMHRKSPATDIAPSASRPTARSLISSSPAKVPLKYPIMQA